MTALTRLKELYLHENRKKYPNFPDHLRPMKNIKTTTANGLTKAIVDFLNMSSHFASRINNTGTWVREKAHANGGFYRPSTQVKGIADVTATIRGVSVSIEIKVGKDRQSDAQLAYQERIERAGGHYWIVRTFDDFMLRYDAFMKEF